MSDRELIINVLRRIRRRQGLGHALRQTAWALAVVVPLGWALKASEQLETSYLVGALLGMSVLWWWSFLRPSSLARVAAEADRRLQLRDELKTAYGFIREDRASPWIDLQIRYAAETARGLEPRAVAPQVVPKALLAADGLLLALAVVWTLAGPGLPRGEDSTTAVSDLYEGAERVERRLESLAVGEAEPLERLQETLEQVEQGQMSFEDGLQALQDAENELTEASLEAGALRDELSRVAEALEGGDGLDDVAQALEQGRLQEAAELLRELAEGAAAAGIDLGEVKQRLELAKTRSISLDEWLDELRRAIEALEAGSTEEAQRLLESAEETLSGIGGRLESQRQMSEAGRELQRLRGAVARKRAGLVQRVQPREQDTAELAEALARLGLQDSQKPRGGNPNGAPMGLLGPPESAETGEPTPLDVQLERQMLGEQREEPQDEEIRERPSRQQTPKVKRQSLRSPERYLEADVMHREVIPWPYRSLVRDYFRALRR